MKSFLVLLLALLVIASQATEQSVRRRVQSSGVNKRGERGASAQYENLSDEIEVEAKNRVQRRFLEDKESEKLAKGDDDDDDDDDDAGSGKGKDKGEEEEVVAEDMSMSMSMSMSLSMSM